MPFRSYWPYAVAAFGILVAAYLLWPSAPVEPARPALATAAGFDELGECSSTLSIDGNKGLALDADGQATALDYAAIKTGGSLEAHSRAGAWRYDTAAQRYIVTFNATSVSYTLVLSEAVGICILLKGSAQSADLDGSWFSTASPTTADGPD